MFLQILLPVLLSDAVQCAKCPARYQRYTLDHTFCKGPNPSCWVLASGVSPEDKRIILKVHNELRSKVATGKERQAGGLPPATNMLQMKWDDELAVIAQRLANQCSFEHDCNECRAVDNFPVGQNLYLTINHCSGGSCQNSPPRWDKAIKSFYEEVKFFDKKYVSRFKPHPEYGHLTQVIWASSWKVGCGYVSYREGRNRKGLYVCNHGPAGNLDAAPVYTAGSSCTECPANTCCSTSCNALGPTYPGLCKIKDTTVGPQTMKKVGHYFCDWSDGNEYCSITATGKWLKRKTLSGNYLTVTVDGGKTATLKMLKAYKPKAADGCFVVHFRKGHQYAGHTDRSSIKGTLEEGQYSLDVDFRSYMVDPNHLWRSVAAHSINSLFIKNSISFAWSKETTATITFSVPYNGGPHILDIKSVEFYDGECL